MESILPCIRRVFVTLYCTTYFLTALSHCHCSDFDKIAWDFDDFGQCRVLEHCRESEAHRKRDRSEYNIYWKRSCEACHAAIFLTASKPIGRLWRWEGSTWCLHINCLHGLWKVARSKLVGCNIISSFDTWTLKTTYTNGEDRSRSKET